MTNIFSRAQFGVFIGAALLVVVLNALQYFGLLHPVMIIVATISSVLLGIVIGAPGYLMKCWEDSIENFHSSVFLRYRHYDILHVLWGTMCILLMSYLNMKFRLEWILVNAFGNAFAVLQPISFLVTLIIGYFVVLHYARKYFEKRWNVKSTCDRVEVLKGFYETKIEYIGLRKNLSKVGLSMSVVKACMGFLLFIVQILVIPAAAIFAFVITVAGLFLLSVYLSRVISQFKGASITVSILVGAIVGVSLGWTHMDAMKLLNFSIAGGAVGSLFHLAISKVAMQYHKLASNSRPYKRLINIFG